MSERLSDINSMFNTPRGALGAVIVRNVSDSLEQGGDSDNLRAVRGQG